MWNSFKSMSHEIDHRFIELKKIKKIRLPLFINKTNVYSSMLIYTLSGGSILDSINNVPYAGLY